MTNMIVHDLKNPLTSIMGLSHLLKSMPKLDEEKQRSYYRLIYEESKRILQMVQEILTFVRGERPEVSRKPCDLQMFLEDVREEIEAFLNSSGIRFRVEAVGSPTLRIDPEQMKRVLNNLVGNAREAMEEAGEVVLTVAENQEHLLFRVSDTGKGIPQDFHQMVFEPFFTRGKKSGNGMGLAIVKQIIKAHDGEIELESSSEKGTVFCIRLPREKQESQPAPLPAETTV